MSSHLPEPPTAKDILNLTTRMQQNLRAVQADLVTVRSYLAAQGAADRRYDHVCPWPHCQIGFLTADRLEEHLANVHDGAPA